MCVRNASADYLLGARAVIALAHALCVCFKAAMNSEDVSASRCIPFFTNVAVNNRDGSPRP
eukprot:6195792-Pleurochrysis_carterae.AAC.4